MVGDVAAYTPTDCPTAEKRGYLGDASFASPGTLWNFDFGSVYRSFATVIADSQHPSGEVPDSVPCPHPHIEASPCGGGATWDFPVRWGPAWCNDVAWTSGFPLIAARAYEFSGDPRSAAAHWGSLTRYIENLIAKAGHFANNVTACDPGESYWHGENLALGDWCAPANCTGRPAGSRCQISAEMSGFSYVMSLRAMAALAAAVKDDAAHARYAALAAAATAGFHTNHWNEALASYGGDEGVVQTLNVPALALGSAPSPKQRGQVAAAIRHDLEARTNYHLSTGAVMSNWLLNVLSDNSMHDAALRVASQTTFPSWGWWLAMNATTCWETWHNGTGHHTGIGPFLGSVNSHNHVFLCGGVSQWMWNQLAGIKSTAPGFATVSVAPRVDPALGPASVVARYRTPRGVVKVAWNRTDAAVRLRVQIPVGIEAAVVSVPTPFGGAHTIAESGIDVWDGASVQHAGLATQRLQWLPDKSNTHRVSFAVGSGRYVFVAAAAAAAGAALGGHSASPPL